MSVDFNPSLAAVSGEKVNGAKSARTPEQAAELRDAAKQFESLMLRQLFVQMQRSASIDGEQGMATEFYGDMFAERMAESSSDQGGIGIANVLMRSWGVEPAAVETSGEPDEWSPQDLEEFSRYQAPIEGAFAVEQKGRTLTTRADDATVVAPRAGRMRVADGAAHIEHPGGWSSRIDGVEVPGELDGAWVNPGTELGNGRSVAVTITRPVVTVA